MKNVSCENCGNRFDADIARVETLKTPRGIQESAICPQCGGTSENRTINGKSIKADFADGDPEDQPIKKSRKRRR